MFDRKRQVDSDVVVDAAADAGAAAVPPPRSGALAAFHSREFSVFFTAGFLSNTGTWMQTVTVPFVIDQLTHSTALVGVSAFATFFPATVIGPLAGSLSDRYDRRNVLIWAQVVMMVMATALVDHVGHRRRDDRTHPRARRDLGARRGHHHRRVAVVRAATRAEVRPPERGARQLDAVHRRTRAFGPTLAGLVLATLGASWAFGANAISYLCVIGALLFISPKPPLHPDTSGRVLQHFREGVRYVRQRAVLFIAMLMVILIALFGVAIVQLLEPIARHVFHVGAGRYGLMTGAYGLGAVIGGVFMVAFGDTFRRSRLAIVGLALMAVGVISLGATRVYGVALAALLAMGLAQVLCMVSCNTAIQLNVDENYRGRASSIFTMSFFAAGPIGALVAGIIGDLLNLRVTVVAAGVVLASCLVFALFRFHGLRPLDESPPVSDEAPVAAAQLPPPTDLDSAAHLAVERVD